MYLEKVRNYLRSYGLEDRLRVFDISSATVALAAQAVGTQEARIAKSLSFEVEDRIILIVTAGDAKIDNRKFKDIFSTKAKMLDISKVEEKIGFDVGGVCPFGVNEEVEIFLDVSLKRFESVFPAGGTASSAVELSPRELEEILPTSSWIDVCKGWSQ